MNGALINNEIFISIKGLETLLGRLYGSSKRIFMSETLLQLIIDHTRSSAKRSGKPSYVLVYTLKLRKLDVKVVRG